MEGTIADEIYSEAVHLSQVDLDSISLTSAKKQCDSCDCNGHGLRNEDDSFWYGSDGELNSPSGLSMEWQSRRKQFYNIGYRDGLQEGKEATVQEGFNHGFKQSLRVGYNWGLVRGVSSALACLPDDLKEKLVQAPENKDKLHRLYESVHALSTTDALKLFHDVAKNSVDEMVNTEVSSHSSRWNSLDCNILENYSKELRSFLSESPAIEVHLSMNQ